MRGGNPGWRPLCPALCMICCIAILYSNLMICMQARYKVQLDPTVEEVKKLCSTCRKYAKTERVLFHYNGHGVPKPTASGEIWLFNKVYMFIYYSFLIMPVIVLFSQFFMVQSYTQYIPLPISDLDSWLKTPSIYVFDCSAAGMIVNAFTEVLIVNCVFSSIYFICTNLSSSGALFSFFF